MRRRWDYLGNLRAWWAAQRGRGCPEPEPAIVLTAINLAGAALLRQQGRISDQEYFAMMTVLVAIDRLEREGGRR